MTEQNLCHYPESITGDGVVKAPCYASKHMVCIELSFDAQHHSATGPAPNPFKKPTKKERQKLIARQQWLKISFRDGRGVQDCMVGWANVIK